MIDRRDMFKTFAAATAAAFIAHDTPALAGTGAVRLNFAGAGFIIGVGGGQGTLTFRGRTFPLQIGGISVGVIGAAGGTLVGRALHLRSPGDIVGTYAAIGTGIAVAAGRRVARLQNQNGVILELHGNQIGFQANFGLGGFSLSM